VLVGSLALLGLLAVAAPFLSRALGRDAGYVLAAGMLAAAGLVAVASPAALDGGATTQTYPWVPSLGVELSLRLDAVALVFDILVLGIGALVLAYTARYSGPAQRSERLYTLLAVFAAAMHGLVLAGDALLMFVFWEATSITSFLLIGGDGVKGRTGAKRAFLVTAAGGLALFAGLVLLGVTVGSFAIPEMLAAGETVRAQPAVAVAVGGLLAAAAFTKSAQVPFHFWLPGAMVAPTPVSTYLHAATMVKAGIYLLARFTPLFAGVPAWMLLLIGVGLATALYTALLALKATDLKALLAYSTTSMLGFLVALIGVGTPEALAAAGLLVLTHGAYKATLFMVAGIVDHEAGTRDIRDLTGLRNAMPATAVVAALACASMAALPPFLGFVGKEEALAAFLAIEALPAALGYVIVGIAGLVAVATFGYSWRLLAGAFGGGGRAENGGGVHAPPRSFLAPPAVTAVAGLGLGLAVPVLDPLIGSFAVVSAGAGEVGDVHLALWHGIELPLILSAAAVLAGLELFVRTSRVERGLVGLTARSSGAGGFDRLYDLALRSGKGIGAPFVPDSPARHLGWVVAVAVGAALAAAWSVRGAVELGGHPDLPADIAIAVLLALALVALTVTADRLAAVALLGAVGFLVAGFYVLVGAPDLALTQLLIETLTVVLVVLVFRRLPRRFPATGTRRLVVTGTVAVVTGVVTAFGAAAMTGQREASPLGTYFLEAAPEEAGGQNVVNTILVDFRALDTFGEITVLAVAGLGIYALATIGRRIRRPDEVAGAQEEAVR
jgi:multicomponent Na+:H+ antiporter subunit A